jgi:chromosome segregation ATPase
MAGGSEYKLNGRIVAYGRYNAALEAHNILVKAKNFLVFQVRMRASWRSWRCPS